MDSKINYYELLGINRDVTLKEIKDAYRKMTRLYHPYNNKEMTEEEYHKMMCLVNLAYATLRDPEKREIYDETLDIRQGKGAFESCNPKAHSNLSPEQYEYYNSVDFDEELQRVFLKWLEEFIKEYTNYIVIHILTEKVDNYDEIDYIYESFREILEYERSYFNTNRKGLRY